MNISNLKSKFPVFKKNPNLVFLDTAASALKVDEMIETTNNCYTNEYAKNHRGNYELSSKLTKKFEDA
jgi:Selenocysteine lyase